MKKVIERNMVDNCEAEWAASQESFEAVKRELQEKGIIAIIAKNCKNLETK